MITRRGFLASSAVAMAGLACGQSADHDSGVTVVQDGDTVTIHNRTSHAVGFRAMALQVDGRWVLHDMEFTGAWDVGSET